MIVDEEGWEEIRTGLEGLLETVFEIQSSSAERLLRRMPPAFRSPWR